MQLIKNIKGFSLIEILVGLGLLGGIGYWAMQSFEFQGKATKTVELRREYEVIQNDIRQILSISEACEANFKDWVVPPTTSSVQPFHSKNIVYVDKLGGAQIDRFIISINPSSAPKYGNKNVQLTGIKLSPDSQNFMGPGELEGKTNVILKFYFQNKKKFGVSEMIRKIPMKVVINNLTDRKIVTCSAIGSMSAMDDMYLKLVGGTMRGDIIMADGAGINFLSDKRFKYNISSLPKITEHFQKLRPVTYKWIDQESLNYGFIAQDVQKVFPELVEKNDNGLLRVKYLQISPFALKALQERHKEISEMQNSLDKIENDQKKLLEVVGY